MSIPHFKEALAMRMESAIQDEVAMLVEQSLATPDEMRLRQGRINGIKIALDIINEVYRKHG